MMRRRERRFSEQIAVKLLLLLLLPPPPVCVQLVTIYSCWTRPTTSTLTVNFCLRSKLSYHRFALAAPATCQPAQPALHRCSSVTTGIQTGQPPLYRMTSSGGRPVTSPPTRRSEWLRIGRQATTGNRCQGNCQCDDHDVTDQYGR